MTSGLVKPEDIASLPIEERGQLITRALEESKSWLTVATRGTDPTPIAEFKAWAESLVEPRSTTDHDEVPPAPSADVIAIVYPPDDRPTRGKINLYVIYGDDGHLLYIGQTTDIRRRLRQHRSRNPWWWEHAAQAWVIAGNTRDEAAHLERSLIAASDPPGNTHHRRFNQ